MQKIKYAVYNSDTSYRELNTIGFLLRDRYIDTKASAIFVNIKYVGSVRFEIAVFKITSVRRIITLQIDLSKKTDYEQICIHHHFASITPDQECYETEYSHTEPSSLAMITNDKPNNIEEKHEN